jgi:hypothetical protein
MLLEGYCSWPKLLNTYAIPFTRYLKNTSGSITYPLKLGGVFQKYIGLHNISFETWRGIV